MLTIDLFSSYGFWLVLGLLLLISELAAPGVIAVFFGIGALTVGILTLAGVIDSLPIQLLCFSLVSLLALFGLRRRFRRALRGNVSDRSSGPDEGDQVGARVAVLEDFEQGEGTVQLNGAKWDAESDEPLKAGDAAWVSAHRGIVLKVTANRPAARESLKT